MERECSIWRLASETIDAIVEKNPLDQTLFKEAMSIALLSGDIPKVCRGALPFPRTTLKFPRYDCRFCV